VGTSSHLLRWQIATLLLLFVGYSGYYLCRSNLSVATPLILEEMAGSDSGPEYADALSRLGAIISLGTLAYTIGKFIFGVTGDHIGGRRSFLAGMSGAVLFTIVFGFGGSFPVFTLAWIGNRFVQASGWPALVKIGSRWFDYRWHGTAMAILSLSFLFGDAAARAFMGLLLAYKLGWRTVFAVTAAVLAGILAVCFVFLRESPESIGEAEASASPANVYGENAASSVGRILLPLLRSPAFWIVCVLSLVMTLLRETFNTWIPQYFKAELHFQTDRAAMLSSGFPFLGGCSTLAAGFLNDWLGRAGRSLIILAGLMMTALSLGLLSMMGDGPPVWTAVALVLLTGFFLLGPYSYLAGAVALDFGGKKGSATACGIIDGVGYLGAYYAGKGVADLAKNGWSLAWTVLAAVALAGVLAAALYCVDQIRRSRVAAAPGNAS